MWEQSITLWTRLVADETHLVDPPFVASWPVVVDVQSVAQLGGQPTPLWPGSVNHINMYCMHGPVHRMHVHY